MVLLFPFKVAGGHVNSSLGKSSSHLLMKALLYPRLNYFKKTIPHKAAAHASIAHMWQYLSAVKPNVVCNFQMGDTYHQSGKTGSAVIPSNLTQ